MQFPCKAPFRDVDPIRKYLAMTYTNNYCDVAAHGPISRGRRSVPALLCHSEQIST